MLLPTNGVLLRGRCMEKHFRFSGAVVVVLCLCLSANAQLPTGTISGVVKDATGAVVPGVSVTATNVERGLTRSVTSTEDGSYRFSALPVGPYNIRAEHPGFQTKVEQGLVLAVGAEAVLNIVLEVGAAGDDPSVT